MNTKLTQLEAKLRRYRLGDSPSARESVLNEIYDAVLDQEIYGSLWDEAILLGTKELFQEDPPNEEVYGAAVRFLQDRQLRVSTINDVFYKIIDTAIQLKDAVAVSAVRAHEHVGTANVLLVALKKKIGIVLPISASVRSGTGQAKLTSTSEATFSDAVRRAHDDLVTRRWLSSSQDVVLSAELTDAEYSGSSIALGAAMAIVSAARDSVLDCYTAFTGDINLQGQEWRIRRVEGIEEKLQAAANAGCRRVVIPAENEHDVPAVLREAHAHRLPRFPECATNSPSAPHTRPRMELRPCWPAYRARRRAKLGESQQ